MENLNGIIKNYLEACAQESDAKKRKESAKQIIIDAIGNNDGITTDLFAVIVKKTSSVKLDTKTLYKDFPDIKNVYGKESVSVSLAIADNVKSDVKTA